MFARFDENPAMTLQDIKETKRYGQTDARTDIVKTVYPPQTKFAGGIITFNYTPISGGLDIAFNTFLDGCDFCFLLITFANSLDPDQDRQNRSSLLHLGLHCLPNYQFTIF